MSIVEIANTMAWGANIIFIYGGIALGKKHISGWYAQIFANLIYIFQSIVVNNKPLLMLSIVLALISLKGLISWLKPIQRPVGAINHAEKSYYTAILKHYNNEV